MKRFCNQLLLLAGLAYTICGIGLYFSFHVGIDGDGCGIFLPPIEINEKVPIGDFPELAVRALLLGFLLLIPSIVSFLRRRKTMR